MAKFRREHGRRSSRARSWGGFIVIIFLLILAGVLFFGGPEKLQLFPMTEASEGSTDIEELMDVRLYLPSGVDGQMIHRTFYSLNYIPEWGMAQWVAYDLTREMMNAPKFERDHLFDIDPLVKENVIGPGDYQGSGFTRGHLVPAADMSFNEDAIRESFYMSNIVPQKRGFNQGIWLELEELCRDWARKHEWVIISSGPVFDGGVMKYFKNRKVGVPDSFFKVIYAPQIKQGIGFILPNETTEGRIEQYAVTIDQVEKSTGIDFFRNFLEVKQQLKVEGTIEFNYWPLSEERFQLRVNEWNKR